MDLVYDLSMKIRDSGDRCSSERVIGSFFKNVSILPESIYIKLIKKSHSNGLNKLHGNTQTEQMAAG
jgi:hypothetical protein